MIDTEQNLTRYLLGEMTEPEQLALEERYFTEPEVFQQLLETESALVDSYARGRLSEDLRARFERSYLNHPARFDRAKFAAALAEWIDRPGVMPPQASPAVAAAPWWQRLAAFWNALTPAVRYSAALAALAIIFGTTAVLVVQQRHQNTAREIAAAQKQHERELAEQAAAERKRQEDVAAQTGSPQPQAPTPQPPLQTVPTPNTPTAPRVLALALTIGAVRGGGGDRVPTLNLTPEVTQVRLSLTLNSNDYSAYRATLRSAAGAVIFSQSNVKPGQAGANASFVFAVPAAKLVNGDYVLTISGVDPNGDVDDLGKSLFHVDRK